MADEAIDLYGDVDDFAQVMDCRARIYYFTSFVWILNSVALFCCLADSV